MSTVRQLLATLLVAGIALAGVATGTAPAHAASGVQSTDPPCEWVQWGTDSRCDGLDPWGVAHSVECGLGDAVDSVELHAGSTFLAYVDLYYARGTRTAAYPNGTCRTAWGEITVFNEDVNYCRVEVRRNSDGQIFEHYGAAFTPGRTAVVYDASVSSYAWAICLYNGRYYTTRTINY